MPKSVSGVVTTSKTRYIVSESSGAWDVHHKATRDIGPFVLCLMGGSRKGARKKPWRDGLAF